MTLLAPFWMLLLVPWGALWVWAGRGGRAARVPFLILWPRSPVTRGPRRQRPPLWAVLLLLATGLAIVAAAGPARVMPAAAWTVVIDNGPAMTAVRLRDALARLPIDRAARVRVVPSVGEPFEQAGGVDVGRLTRSALADDDRLLAAVRRAGGGAVVVTDRLVPGLPGSVPVITPSKTLVNAGIDRFAVAAFQGRTAATAQAMVRVYNGTVRARARLRVDDIEQAIDLPPTGTTRDYFIDLPPPGDTAVATLLNEHGKAFGDDILADDRAYLAKTHRTPRIDPAGPLPTALSRFVAVYMTRRPPEPGGAVVTIGGALADGPGVRLAGSFASPAAATRPTARALSIDASHPVTRTADLRVLADAPRVGNGPAADGGGAWRVLARDGDDVLLAVREAPARQVWIGVDTTAMANTPDFVVLWADVLDWVGGGAAAWASGPMRDGLIATDVADPTLAGGPGLYRDEDRTTAITMPAVRAGDVKEAPALPYAIRTTVVPVTAWVLLAALGLLVVGLSLARGADAHFRSRLNKVSSSVEDR